MIIIGRRRELIVATLFYLNGVIVTVVRLFLFVVVVGHFVYGVGIGLIIDIIYLFFLWILALTWKVQRLQNFEHMK